MAIHMEDEMKRLKLREDRTKTEYFKKQIAFLKVVELIKKGESCKDIRVLLNQLTIDELCTAEQSRTSGNVKQLLHVGANEKHCCECN